MWRTLQKCKKYYHNTNEVSISQWVLCRITFFFREEKLCKCWGNQVPRKPKMNHQVFRSAQPVSSSFCHSFIYQTFINFLLFSVSTIQACLRGALSFGGKRWVRKRWILGVEEPPVICGERGTQRRGSTLSPQYSTSSSGDTAIRPGSGGTGAWERTENSCTLNPIP